MQLERAYIKEIDAMTTGQSQRGTWKAVNVVVVDATPIPHPDEVLIRFFGEQAEKVVQMRIGDMVKVIWESAVHCYTKQNGELGKSAENRGFSIVHIS